MCSLDYGHETLRELGTKLQAASVSCSWGHELGLRAWSTAINNPVSLRSLGHVGQLTHSLHVKNNINITLVVQFVRPALVFFFVRIASAPANSTQV